LEHDSALINDKVDNRNPHRARMTNPVLIHRAFVRSRDFNPSLYFKTLLDLVRTQSYCRNMKTITTHYAKTHLSRLLKEVQQGEEVIILNGQTPAGRLVAVAPSTSRRPTVGTVTSNPATCVEDAFAPLDNAALKDWGL
jgi:antitoxin (DNA-binding transcriptional repressor) of toxin-antitoxin stability system